MTRVAIAVPVRDEENGLPGLLSALSAQVTTPDIAMRVVLLFDGCTDRGAEIAKAFFAQGQMDGVVDVKPRSATPSAGRARKLATDLAMAQAVAGGPADILLTTDADTVADPDWVSTAVRALRDVDVVAGHSRRDGTCILPARDALERYLEALHALRRRIDVIPYDPAPSHPWVGGANLGMTAQAFRALDGFAPLTTGEDRDLVDRARHAGLRVRHEPEMRVVTSSRMTGRAKGGLADALRHMAAEAEEPLVEHPEDAARQYARHALARRAFGYDPARADWAALAQAIGTTADLRALAAACTNAEAFVMRAVPAHPTRRTLTLSQAAAALAQVTPDGAFAMIESPHDLVP